MKRSPSLPIRILVVLLILATNVWLLAAAAPAAVSPRTDAHASFLRPVAAADVVLVPKATLKGAPGDKGSKPPSTPKLASTGTLGAPLPSEGRRFAIVMGISDYPGTSSDLQYGDDDAREVRGVLMDTYHFPDTNIKMLVDRDATRANLKAELDAFVTANQIGSKDELVFYYSGHGSKGRADDGDATTKDVAIVICNSTYTGFDFVWDGELLSMFKGYPAGRIVFVFDSCLSGGMNVLAGTGRFVAMACSATSYSYEGSQWGGGNGQFTYYMLISGMGAAKADKNLDTFVPVEEGYDYAKAMCTLQAPQFTDGFTNDLLP